jgi:hypothetical protein
MGVYKYMARKGQPLNIVFQSQKIQVHRFVYLSRLSDEDSNAVGRVAARIEAAWAGDKPRYGALVDSPKEIGFAWIYGDIANIVWYDCDPVFGKIVGCVVRNKAGKLVTYTEPEFADILRRVTGYTRDELWQGQRIIIDSTTEAGFLVNSYLEHCGLSHRVVDLPLAEECSNVVI